MDEIPLGKLLSRLNDYLDTKITEEELLKKLIFGENTFKKNKPTSNEETDYNKERLIILQSLLALFSKDYEVDLQKAVNVENELARKLSNLQFTSKENRLLFVQGKCSKEEQEVVCGKIFKALNLVIAGEEADLLGVPRIILYQDAEKQIGQPKSGHFKLRKTQRRFDLDQAKRTLCECKELISKIKSSDEEDSMLKPLDGIKEDYEVIVNDTDISETARLAKLSETKFKCGLYSPDHNKENRSALSTQLGLAVEKLHPMLQSINTVTSRSSKKKKTRNPSNDTVKMLGRAKEMRENSVVSKCLSPGAFLPLDSP